MRTFLAALLLSTALFAGCAGAPDTPAAARGSSADTVPAAEAAGSGVPPSSAPEELATEVCSAIVNVGTGVSSNLHLAYVGCAFEKAAPGDLSRFGGALVEVAWPDPLPTITAFDFFLLSDSCQFDGGVSPCYHDHVSSAEPWVRYPVPPSILRDFGSDGLRAYASFDGVAVQQEIVIAVTLVPVGMELAPEYSGLP